MKTYFLVLLIGCLGWLGLGEARAGASLDIFPVDIAGNREADLVNHCPSSPPEDPEGLILTSNFNEDAYPVIGEPFEIDVSAQNFTDLTAFNFYINWAPFVGSFPISGVVIDTIIWHPLIAGGVQFVNAGSQQLQYRWTNPEGLSIPPTEPLVVVRVRLQDEAFRDIVIVNRVAEVQNSQGQAVDGAYTRHRLFVVDDDFCRLRFLPTEVSSAGIFQVPLVVDQFDELIGLQFSMAYDTSLVELADVVLFIESGLPIIFGTNRPGRVTFFWTEPQLAGLSLEAGDTLLVLSFRALQIGQTEVALSDFPTAIEGINSLDQLVRVIATPAAITVLPNLYVYPGDMDANGVVNHFDLLSLGVAAGQNHSGGVPRTAAATDWSAQPALAWQAHTPGSHVNLAHADADGDGVISAPDADWIAAHYHQQNEYWNGDLMMHAVLPAAPMSVQPSLYVRTDTLYPETTLATFDLVLGEEQAPASDAYGLAFSIYYDPQWVTPGSMNATFEQGWLAGANPAILTWASDHPELGRIDIAITRTDGQAFTGAGAIGQLHWAPLLPAFSGPEAIRFQPEHVLYINAEEQRLPINTITTFAPTVEEEVTNTHPDPAFQAAIQVYPNPVADRVFIQANGQAITSVTCWNAAGQLVRSFGPGSATADLSGLPAGTYTLKIQGADGWVASHTVVKR